MKHRWQAQSFAQFDVHTADNFYIIFDPRFEGTHVLTETSYEILKTVSKTPLSLSGIIDSLSDVFELEADGTIEDVISARIQELDNLGLIEPVL